MTWLAWRQHRHHLLAAATSIGVIATAFLAMRGALVAYLHDSGLTAGGRKRGAGPARSRRASGALTTIRSTG